MSRTKMYGRVNGDYAGPLDEMDDSIRDLESDVLRIEDDIINLTRRVDILAMDTLLDDENKVVAFIKKSIPVVSIIMSIVSMIWTYRNSK